MTGSEWAFAGGLGISILLGIVHFASTKAALKRFEGPAVNEARMLLAVWNGVSFMLLFLGGPPMALVLLEVYVGRAATVVGIAAAAFAGITVIADVIAYRRTTIAMGKAVPPILAVVGTLLESVVTPGPARKEGQALPSWIYAQGGQRTRLCTP